jgi:hypothetical protein
MSRPWLSLRVLALFALLGCGAALAAGGWFLLADREPSLPPLTAPALQAAEARWREHGPASYNLDVSITGRQSGQFHVEVRDGKVTACTRDGITPRPHTWDTWSVDGQFDTLARELEGAADPQKVYGAPAGADVRQGAQFDAEFGYPLRYERHVFGADLPIGWRVTRFEQAPQ